jgi:hypothetical protein
MKLKWTSFSSSVIESADLAVDDGCDVEVGEDIVWESFVRGNFRS